MDDGRDITDMPMWGKSTSVEVALLNRREPYVCRCPESDVCRCRETCLPAGTVGLTHEIRWETTLFESKREIPRAVSGSTPDDHQTAEQWCIDRMEPGDQLLVWFAQKNIVDNDPAIEAFCAQSRVQVGTTRARTAPAGWTHGPALVMWPDMDDLAMVEGL